MDWRPIAKDRLRYHLVKKNGLESVRAEIRILESELYKIQSATNDGTPVRGGGNKQNDRFVSIFVHCEELKNNYNLTKSIVDRVDGALDQLTVEERKILEQLYMNPSKGNVLRLCEELNIEQATVYRWRDAALKRFTIALYGITES